MFTSIKRSRIAAALASAGLLALPGEPAARDQGSTIEEIVVTAQHREQSLQDVAMSLSALSAEALDDRVIEDLNDLQFSVPNLLADGRNGITIRGVGNNAISSTAEDGLGFYINGVYVNRPLTRNSEYFDLERIEVLRGPQGTLYGRNTTAGVINVLTRRPGEEFGGHLRVSAGNYASYRARGAVDVPLTDRLRQRFAGFVVKRDGYNDNVLTGNATDGRDSYELRSSTSVDLGADSSVALIVTYLNEDSNRAHETKGTCTKDPVTACSALSAGFETPDVSGSIFQTINTRFLNGSLFPAGDYFANAINPANYRKVYLDQEPTYEAEQLGVSFEFTHDFGEYRFTSLTGYYDTDRDFFQDFDRFATDVRLFNPLTYRANARDVVTTDRIQSGRRDILDADQFTQEFRLASVFEARINFLLGAFYYRESATNQVLITHPSLAAFQQARGLTEDFEWFNVESDPLDTKSLALFGELYYDIDNQTRLTLGLRYTDDRKAVRTRQQFLILVDPAWNAAAAEWQEFTGKGTLEHHLGDNAMLFATLARGYKAGGANPGGPTGGELFKPEYINQVEIGAKSTFADGRVLANFGAFYYEQEDLQIGQVSQTSAVTVNGDARVIGAEGEFAWQLASAFELDLAVSWLDVELDSFHSADQGDPRGIAPGTRPALDGRGMTRFTSNGLLIKDLDGNALRNAPEFSVKIGAQYVASFSDGYRLTGRIDHFWQDDYFANEFNKPSDVINSWSQTDVQLILTRGPPLSGERWYLKLFVKNLFDNDDILRRGQDGPLVGRFRSVTALEPRLYGVELSMSF